MARPALVELRAEIDAHLDDARRGEQLREGLHIAIIGPPNAGKSSLLNALAQREAAIVSDIPGTTRDVVEVRLVLAGYPVWIADTAGLREAADAIEAEGVRRALARAEEADLRVLAVESGEDGPSWAERVLRDGDIWLYTKSDLKWPPQGDIPGYTRRTTADQIQPILRDRTWRTIGPMPFSVHDPVDVANLIELLTAVAELALGREEAPVLTRARHRSLVEEARAALLRAIPALEVGPELAAEDARVAADQIGRLTGRIDVEDLLGEIFSSFCIGK
jgi:tRNA modification GTPase